MKKIIGVSLFSVMILALALPVVVEAAVTTVGSAPDSNISSITDVVAVIDTIVNWFFAIIIGIAAIMIIYAGFLWMTSGGDEEKTGNARKTLIYALIGVVVAVVAKGLVTLIRTLVE